MFAHHEICTHGLRALNDRVQPWAMTGGPTARCKRFGLASLGSRESGASEEGLASLHSMLGCPDPSHRYLWNAALLYYAAAKGAELNFFELFDDLGKWVGDRERRFLVVARVKRGIVDSRKRGASGESQCYFEGAVDLLRRISAAAPSSESAESYGAPRNAETDDFEDKGVVIRCASLTPIASDIGHRFLDYGDRCKLHQHLLPNLWEGRGSICNTGVNGDIKACVSVSTFCATSSKSICNEVPISKRKEAIYRPSSSLDLRLMYTGKVCVRQMNRVRRLARWSGVTLPRFMMDDYEGYISQLRAIAVLNGLA